MRSSVKTNRLALISFVSGVLAALIVALVFVVYNLLEPASAIINLTDAVLMPLRNVLLLAAMVTGVLGLLDIKKKDGAERGKGFAWVGIVVSAAWIIFGLLVGLFFLSAR